MAIYHRYIHTYIHTAESILSHCGVQYLLHMHAPVMMVAARTSIRNTISALATATPIMRADSLLELGLLELGLLELGLLELGLLELGLLELGLLELGSLVVGSLDGNGEEVGAAMSTLTVVEDEGVVEMVDDSRRVVAGSIVQDNVMGTIIFPLPPDPPPPEPLSVMDTSPVAQVLDNAADSEELSIAPLPLIHSAYCDKE